MFTPRKESKQNSKMQTNNNIKNNNQHKFKSDAQKNAFKIWNQKVNKNKIVLEYGQKFFKALTSVYQAVTNFYKNKPNGKFFCNQKTVFEKYVSKKFGELPKEDKDLYYRFSEIGKHVIKDEELNRLNLIKNKIIAMSQRHYKRAIEWLVKNNKIKIAWDDQINRWVWKHVGLLQWLEFNETKERVSKNGKAIKYHIFKCWKSIQKMLFPFIKEKLHSEEILNNIKANSPPDEVEEFDWSKVEDQED